MKIALWITQVLLALMFLMAGFMKLSMPYDDLIQDPNMGWAQDFSPMKIMLIGVYELIFALLVIIPALLKKFTKFSIIASVLLATEMAVAAAVHVGRDEAIYMNVILMLLALFVAYAKLKKSKSNDGI